MTNETEEWATNEAHLQIANDYELYQIMLDCRTLEQFKRTFRNAVLGVYGPHVDWSQVWDWFTDDREGR